MKPLNFGSQITQLAILDRFLKCKTWMLTRIQKRILHTFGTLPDGSRFAQFFSSMSRKWIGAYIYSIKLEINDQCQLKCKMCYVDHKNEELPVTEIYKMLDDIRNYGIRLEILGGEPLMRNDLIQIIDYAKTKSCIPFISLYTNGTLINEKLAAKLKKAGLDAVIVTLISNTPEIHDEFTGAKGSWDKTISGIRNLKNAGITTYTFTAIHQYNYTQFSEIYNFVTDKLGVHALFYQYVPQCKNDPLSIDIYMWNKIKHWVLYDKNNFHMKYIRDFYMLTGNACSGGNYVLTVKVDGSVQPCPFINNLSLGNIKQEDIWTIYKNRYKNTRLKEFKSTPEDCKECTYNSVCGGGCRAGNDLIFGRYDHADHRCLGPFKDKIYKDEVAEKIPTFF